MPHEGMYFPEIPTEYLEYVSILKREHVKLSSLSTGVFLEFISSNFRDECTSFCTSKRKAAGL